jgi:hypothetical protein
MKTYAVLHGHITAAHAALLNEVRSLVLSLPDGLDCHGVCRAVARSVPALTHVAGHFHHKGYQHSWLEIPEEFILIDAYPWAGHGPFLVTVVPLSPWRFVYVPGPVPGVSDESGKTF